MVFQDESYMLTASSEQTALEPLEIAIPKACCTASDHLFGTAVANKKRVLRSTRVTK